MGSNNSSSRPRATSQIIVGNSNPPERFISANRLQTEVAYTKRVAFLTTVGACPERCDFCKGCYALITWKDVTVIPVTSHCICMNCIYNAIK